MFLQTRESSSWLAEQMITAAREVLVLSNELSVERFAVLNRFQAGHEQVLITTNVLSRDICIEQAAIVVNFDLPIDEKDEPDARTYLNRINCIGNSGKL